jgi:hypothetical protein
MSTNPTSNNQTDLKRKAAARKGVATRLRNEAKQKRSFTETAKARGRAESNALLAASFEAGRALDATLGAAVTARDSVVETVRPLGDPRRALSEVRDGASRTFSRFEQRGAKTRGRAHGEAERIGRETKRHAKEAV